MTPSAPLPRTQEPRMVKVKPGTHKVLARVKGRMDAKSSDEAILILLDGWERLTADARHEAIASVRVPKGATR